MSTPIARQINLIRHYCSFETLDALNLQRGQKEDSHSKYKSVKSFTCPVISESLASHRCPTYHRVSVTSGARMLGSKLLLSLYNPLDKPGAGCGDSLVTLTLEMTQ